MNRTATVARVTGETNVEVTVDLDGTGVATIDTGVGMFDHLVGSLSHHSMIDIALTTRGDLHVDDHHTIEDSLAALGEAIDTALGDRSGIHRFGDAVIPMDEARASCALDLGGRPYLVVEAPFRADRIGTMSTQMVEHGLEAFARTMRATLHLQASGRNDHHIAEAMFKALARSLRAAVAPDPRRTGIPSTKGSL